MKYFFLFLTLISFYSVYSMQKSTKALNEYSGKKLIKDGFYCIKTLINKNKKFCENIKNDVFWIERLCGIKPTGFRVLRFLSLKIKYLAEKGDEKKIADEISKHWLLKLLEAYEKSSYLESLKEEKAFEISLISSVDVGLLIHLCQKIETLSKYEIKSGLAEEILEHHFLVTSNSNNEKNFFEKNDLLNLKKELLNRVHEHQAFKDFIHDGCSMTNENLVHIIESSLKCKVSEKIVSNIFDKASLTVSISDGKSYSPKIESLLKKKIKDKLVLKVLEKSGLKKKKRRRTNAPNDKSSFLMDVSIRKSYFKNRLKNPTMPDSGDDTSVPITSEYS